MKIEKKRDNKNIKEKKGNYKLYTSPGNMTIGAYLQELRIKNEYSIQQVSTKTKISSHYIEALERNDFKRTPPMIYVKAYVKKLCSLYGADGKLVSDLLKKIDMEYKTQEEQKLPEQLISNIEETKQVDEKENKKAKFLIWGIISGTILLILLIIIIIILLGSGGNKKVAHKNLPKNNKEIERTIANKMEKLIPPESLEPSELKIPSR